MLFVNILPSRENQELSQGFNPDLNLNVFLNEKFANALLSGGA
jgi:hypothetical protein